MNHANFCVERDVALRSGWSPEKEANRNRRNWERVLLVIELGFSEVIGNGRIWEQE